MSREARVSFWAMPEEGPAAWFAARIAELGMTFEAPAFEPHVTVHGARVSLARAREVARMAALETAPVELEVDEVTAGPSLTKTVYVRFRPSPALTTLQERLVANLGKPSGYDLRPHLSLIYHDGLDSDVRERLAREIVVPWPRVRLTELAAIDLRGPVRDREDVRRWREVGRFRLGGGGR